MIYVYKNIGYELIKNELIEINCTFGELKTFMLNKPERTTLLYGPTLEEAYENYLIKIL